MIKEKFIIPYVDKFDSELYLKFKDFLTWLIRATDGKPPSYNRIREHARTYIFDYICTNDCYQKLYTIEQVERLSTRYADAFIKNQKKLYIY